MTHAPEPVAPEGTGRAPGRVLGVDLGSRRIGLAVSDSNRSVAVPRGHLRRGADPVADRAQLVQLVAELEVTTVVVGLPLSLDGRRGPAARAAADEARALATDLAGSGVEVVTFDERLTTVSAGAALAGAGTRGPKARRVVDAAAAAVLLQAWLDAR